MTSCGHISYLPFSVTHALISFRHVLVLARSFLELPNREPGQPKIGYKLHCMQFNVSLFLVFSPRSPNTRLEDGKSDVARFCVSCPKQNKMKRKISEPMQKLYQTGITVGD
jgi:hypothetical protein